MTIAWNSPVAVSAAGQTGTDTTRGVTVLSDGSYIVAWCGAGLNGVDLDIYVRHYDAQGRAISGAILVNADNILPDTDVSVTALANGAFAVGWISGGTSVNVQRFNADNSPSGANVTVAVDGSSTFFTCLSIAAQSNGSIAVAYNRNIGGDYDVVVRTLSPAGVLGAVNVVHAAVSSDQGNPDILALGSGGGYFMAWYDAAATSGNIVGRFLTSAGVPTGTEFTVNTTVTNEQYTPSAALMADGRIIVTWFDASATGGDTSGSAIRGQILTAAGFLSGPELLLNSQVGSNQFSPNVTALPNGGFALIYYSTAIGGGTIFQAYSATGLADGNPLLLSSSIPDQAAPNIDASALPDGRVALQWLDGTTIMTQIVDPRISGSVITGDTVANIIFGNDSSPDQISGFAGADTLYGFGGNDLLTGGSGNDRIFGGSGSDMASYSRTFGESTVIRLANGSFSVNNATDGTDLLRGVERLQFADRSLSIQGYARSDINGDGDSDILYFSQAGGAIGSFSMEDGFRTSTGAGALVGDTGSGVWDVQATGDFNYDGNSDLVLKNQSTGQFYIWTVQNGVQVGGRDLGVIGTSWDIRSTGDFNADGNGDLLWRDSSNGQFYVWTFNANTVQTGSTNIGVLGNNWDAGTAGDFDGDGDSDILLRNATNGQVYIYSMQNGAVSSGTSVAVLGTDWTLANTGDFNGDGRSDIALKNTSTGQFYLYLMNADLSFTGRDLGIIGTDWNIGSTGDYNEDGTDDILWRNSSTGQIYAWQMEDGRQATTGANHLGFVSADTVIV